MASIRRKPHSKFYHACFYDESGKQVQKSTQTADRKEAQRIADGLEQAHRRQMTEAQMRRLLSDLHERLTDSPLNSATLKDYAARWLANKEKEVEKVSLALYKTAVSEFLLNVPNKLNLGMQYVTPGDISAYRDRCAAKATARTANNKLKILRVFFGSAYRDSIIPENPADKVTTLKTADSVRRPFKLSELKRVYDVANDEWRGMVVAGLYTGQRLKDIATLRWSNIDLEKSEITLTTSKTGRTQSIPLALALKRHLLGLDAPDDPKTPVFPKALALVQKDGDVGRLSQQFYELLVDASLVVERTDEEKARGKGIGRSGKRERNELSFHSLRHTATSLLKNAGAPELVARDIVGHDSEAVSANYSHVDAAAKRDAVAKMPDILLEA
jgi:integrase